MKGKCSISSATERRVVRLAIPGDAARLAEIYRPAIEVTGVSFEEIAPDASEMRQRITTVLVRFPWLVVEEAGEIVGYAYASRHRERPAYSWSAEVSIYVDQANHRGGVGRQLYTALFSILALQGFQTVFAGIVLPNPASLGFHRRMGFVDVGRYQRVGFKAGQWCDTIWLQRAIGSHPVPPPPIRPITEVLTDPAFPAAVAPGGTAMPRA
jgi:L-amino acid N-acyltransferase YncA